jgi:sulfur-oxidizing protein SoxY
MRAHDAATVPIVVYATDPKRRLVKVHLIADQNPLPLAGVFRFSEEAGNWTSFETRIRIDQYTHVRAIAELADGSLHMASSFVKAAGGCSAPAMADLQAAISNAGKMKVMLGEAAESETASSAEAIIKISHPNNSGMQFDQVSRNYIPAFYINKIGAEVNGRSLLDVETNFSLSENPVIRLNFPADANHSEITVFATDSKGNRYEQTAKTEEGAVRLEAPTTIVQ